MNNKFSWDQMLVSIFVLHTAILEIYSSMIIIMHSRLILNIACLLIEANKSMLTLKIITNNTKLFRLLCSY